MDETLLKNLKIEEIILNLKMIAKIKQNDKMFIVNKIIQVDHRQFPGVRRWFTADGRTDTIFFIELVIERSFEYMDKDIDNEVFDRQNIRKELLNIVQGLDNLSATYKLDNLVISKIDILKEKIQKICN
jgi:hypothetical protein